MLIAEEDNVTNDRSDLQILVDDSGDLFKPCKIEENDESTTSDPTSEVPGNSSAVGLAQHRFKSMLNHVFEKCPQWHQNTDLLRLIFPLLGSEFGASESST